MRFILFSMVTFMVLLTTSCASLVKSAVKDAPITNRIFLHPSPKVGDYARLDLKMAGDSKQAAMMRGSSFSEMEIVDISGGKITIEHKVTNTGMMALAGNLHFRYITDMDGNVMKGYFVEGANKTAMKIAKPGDDAYNPFKVISKEDMESWNAPYTISVAAGEFKCTPYYYKDPKNPEKKVIYYINEDVKFGHVASYVVDMDNGSRVSMELTKQR